MVVTGLVSTNVSNASESILPILLDCGMGELVNDIKTHLGNKDKVFLNGDWVGVFPDYSCFMAKLRSKIQKKNELPRFTFNVLCMLS